MSALFWAIVAGVLILLELVIPGLVTVWFGLAGIIMIFLAPLIKNTSIEFCIFGAISLLLLFLTRPIVKKYLYKDDHEPLEDLVKNKETKVKSIVENGLYEVELNGITWRGRSSELLEVNDRVIVVDVTGNKLILKKLVK